MTANHSAGNYSILNYRYLVEEASEPRRLLTYAEQQLILAEAAILGWISSGDAKGYYESGVKSALNNMMDAVPGYENGMPVNEAYIDSYVTGNAAFAESAEEQLEQIWMQRYILNFMQDPKSSYFEYRRTRFPEFPINSATSMNENNKEAIPLRWLYPSSEANYNHENLIEALERQYDGYDEINKLMWLLK